MWQQKQLFDSLFAMASDASLLLKTVENTHLNTCDVIKSEVNNVSAFIDMFIPAFQKSKDSLDRYLLGSNGIIVTPAACTPPFVVSKQMEQLVIENFDVINDFEECFQTIYKQAFLRRSVDEPFLNRFRDIIDRGRVIMEEFRSEPEHEKKFSDICEDGDSSAEDSSKLYASFAEIYEGTIRLVVDAFERLSLSNKGHILPESSIHLLTGNLPSWKVSFDFCLEALQLNHIYDALGRTILAAGKLVSTHSHSQFNLCSHIQASLKYLHALLEVLLTVGDGFLSELLALHKTVGEMTYMLANIFALLYSQGFGTPEGQVDNSGNDTTQDAHGTGMGEGEGVNDVSDQIDDEDQLLGIFDKVIPYIASHYRKDKIWLRRMRPNKRDYQVVVAIDDSRSMSKSHYGEVAIEALITVCQAMSQLEVGQLAAVSFGAQGNVRLLQGFGQPFTGEAGIKMISSLTFKQDNTIVDEPMVNLLKELNGMLDSAVTNARLPTGQNPLRQLILIISDGQIHEKESLKRYV